MEIKEAIEILACISYDDSQGRIAAQTVCLEVTRLQESLDYQVRYNGLIETRNHELRTRITELEEREGNFKAEIARLRNDYLALDQDVAYKLRKKGGGRME